MLGARIDASLNVEIHESVVPSIETELFAVVIVGVISWTVRTGGMGGERARNVSCSALRA